MDVLSRLSRSALLIAAASWFTASTHADTLVALTGSPIDGGELASIERFALNDDDQIGLLGRFDPPAASRRIGFWYGAPTGLSLQLAELAPAPGLPGVTVSQLFRSLLMGDAGAVLSTRLSGTGVDTSNDLALWFAGDNPPTVLVRESDPAPDLPAGVLIAGFGSTRLSDSAQAIALQATLSGAGVDANNSQALYGGSVTSPRLLLRAGQQAPGLIGLTISGFQDIADVNNAGEVAVVVFLEGPGVTEANSRAFYVLSSDGAGGVNAALVARNGDVLLGEQFIDELAGGIEINNAGQLAFRGETRTVSTGIRSNGVFFGSPGNLQLVGFNQPTALFPLGINSLQITDAGTGVAFTSPGAGPGPLVSGPVSNLIPFAPTIQLGATAPLLNDPVDDEIPTSFTYDRFWLTRVNDADTILQIADVATNVRDVRGIFLDGVMVRRNGFLTAAALGFVDPVRIERDNNRDSDINKNGAIVFQGRSDGNEQFLAYVASPAPSADDGDGIFAAVDGTFSGAFVDESAVFSNAFTDKHLGGTTSGLITSRGPTDGVRFFVRDAVDAVDGISIFVTSSVDEEGTVELSDAPCTPAATLTLSNGDSVVTTCASVGVDVLVGEVGVDVGSLAIVAGEGVNVRITEAGDDVVVQHEGSVGTVSVTLDGQTTTLGAGESQSFAAAGSTPLDPPVSDLNARGKGSKAQLVWSPVAEADGYDVYRSTNGGPFELIAENHVSSYATYLDGGLTPGATYAYQVVGKRGANASEPSNVATLTLMSRRSRRR